ncbi:MAG: alternative ribosome rescue aminoacyl-tRNA hydrolase ArfB [Actinomycetes bacterium]
MADVRLSNRVRVPEHELEFRVARAGGPGGQSVNTTDSKVELRWDVEATEALAGWQKALVRERLGNRITKDGVLVIQATEERSQHQNRQAALARFRSLVGEAIVPPKRRVTRQGPSRTQKRKRLEAKRQRGEVKRLRRPPEVP